MLANKLEATRNDAPTASQRAAQRWHDPNVNTDVFEAFAEYQRAQSLSPNTIRNRESLLRVASKRIGAPLLDMTVTELRRYMGRDDIGANTKRTARNALRAFYTYCVEDGWLEVSPAEKLPPVRVPKGEPRPFTRSQIDAMLNSGAYKRTRAMIMLGFFQGFRVSQIAAMNSTDIDLLTQTIRTVAKGGKIRRLPLHPVIADLAHDMPEGWWFPSDLTNTGHVRGHSVTEAITAAKLRAGITDPKLTPHSLRHAFASELVEQGVDIRVVQELMLHEDLGTTQIYTRVSERRKSEGILTIAPMLFPAQAYRKAA